MALEARTFWEAIDSFREEAGMTKKTLALLAGVDQGHLCNTKRLPGKAMSTAKLAKLLTALDVPLGVYAHRVDLLAKSPMRKSR
jgi:transcriptional regulator with XRE-family HTH domain